MEHPLEHRTTGADRPIEAAASHTQTAVDDRADPVTAPAAHGGHGAGHDRHAGHSVSMFRDKFWLSLALTIPVVLLSRDVQEWFGYTTPTFPGSDYLVAVIGTIVFLYGGLVFLRGAQGELDDRQPGMMTRASLRRTPSTNAAGTGN